MSKIETLKAYAREQPALQIVESVRALQASIEQMQHMPQMLQQLPDEIAQILGPMTASSEAMAERVDRLASTQREAIQQFVAQVQNEMRSTISGPVSAINKEVHNVRTNVATLIGEMDKVQTVSERLRRQSEELRSVQAAMVQSGEALAAAAKTATRSGWTWRFLGLLIVGVVSSAATLIGGTVLEQQLDGTARAAATWQHVTTVATEREIELLRQIVSRPAR